MNIVIKILAVGVIALTSFKTQQSENVDFTCIKVHKASNTCHFNFRIDGAKYRFTDIGCKYGKKKDDVIRKAKEGNLALAKDWKIDCPEVKDSKEKKDAF